MMEPQYKVLAILGGPRVIPGAHYTSNQQSIR